MTGEEPFEWGTTVVTGEADGHPCRLWEPRRRLVPELLLDMVPFAERDFLVQDDRRVTYAAHQRAVHRIAGRLFDAGVRPGDRVVLFCANHAETIAAWWAILQVGGVVVLANGWWSAEEIAGAIERVEPRLVLADARRATRLPAGCPVLPLESLRADLDPAGGPPMALPGPTGSEGDPAVILFTSGTTGFPKGAVLSHRAVIANVHNLLIRQTSLPQQQDRSRTPVVNLLALPLFHISGMQTMLLNGLTGGRLVFRSDTRFDPAEVLALIEAERINVVGAVPTMLGRLVDHPDLTRRDLSSVRAIATGGMPVPPVLVERLRAAFPTAQKTVGAIYGLSESGGVLTMISGREYQERPWSSGPPFPVVELRIDQPDEAGGGEILARSPTNMTGYWGLPDDRTVDAEGWLHTGDVGRLDDDQLVIVGRSKDVIIRGGENVAAPHVEACLLGHPDVVEVAVVALSHPDLGEEVAAAVVVRPDHPVTADDLARWAADHLAAFAVPTAWWIRHEPLPTTASGKVVKHEIRTNWPRSAVGTSP